MNYWKLPNEALFAELDKRGIIIDEEDKGNRKHIINLIKIDDLDQGVTDKVLMLDENDEVVEEIKGGKMASDDPFKSDNKYGMKMMRCIFRYGGDGEANYTQLGHNGRCFYIPKDVEVIVPLYLKGVIEDAVIDKMETVIIDGGRRIEQRKTKQPRIHWELKEIIE